MANPEILIFMRPFYKKRSLKPLVPKFHPHLSVRSMDIAEEQVPAKLKPIVDFERIDRFPAGGNHAHSTPGTEQSGFPDGFQGIGLSSSFIFMTRATDMNWLAR